MEFAPLTPENECNGHPSHVERVLTVKVYNGMVAMQRSGTATFPNIWKSLGELMGRSKHTVKKIVQFAFDVDGQMELWAPNRKRSRAEYNHDDMKAFLRSHILGELESGRAVTRTSVGDAIKAHFDLDYTRQAVGVIMKRYGFKYKTLRTQSDKHDDEAYVKLRDTYVRLLTDNRKALQGPRMGLPKRPEVYLDESYVDVKMHPTKGWTIDNARLSRNISQSGRACMVGAGVAFANDDRLVAEWVAGSFETWSSKDGARDIHGNERDYHGNFNAKLFEKWFTKLCITIKDRYGDAIFIMDGAGYHKRCLNPAPGSDAKKAALIEYLTELNEKIVTNGGEAIFDPAAKHCKASLLALIKANKPPKVFAVHTIAQKHGHEVLFTPPYHPELQPIEIVWGALKNHLTANKDWNNVRDLVGSIKRAQEAQGSKVWIGARRRVRSAEDLYISKAIERGALLPRPPPSRPSPSPPLVRPPSKRLRSLPRRFLE